MSSNFGQKKKKEAVRRLSQSAARRQGLESRIGKRAATSGETFSPGSWAGGFGKFPRGTLKPETAHESDSSNSLFQIPKPAAPEITTRSTSVFGSELTSFTKKDDFAAVGFPVTPEDSTTTSKLFDENMPKMPSGGFPSDHNFYVKSDAKDFIFKSDQKKTPLQQVQPIFGSSNEKPFGSIKAAQDEKVTPPDVSKLKSLVVREIPQDCNKNTWLKRFYSRFGEIVKVLCNPAKSSATVTFRTHEAAKLAKVKGKILQKGLPPVSIFWKQERKRTASGSPDKQELIKKTDLTHQGIKDRPAMKEASIDVQSLPPAMSSGDRYKVLEMIDSKLREGQTKASDISTAKAVKGTCPDMCPEKERYMREDRRRLHVFEAIPGTGNMEENPLVDHAKAVKEYDRSAADKEEPLPHELRPVQTLQLTMDYLVTNIMDAGDGRWADWFDFLWNRTRAIRKDITQQHLCEPGAVDLIEKTARFHIFCSHYLCDQDFGVFDPKINTENLTKCLQTLKHFYDDLYKKQNIICPDEAEFRAYDILLNLNEGDILRQVMTYREEVRSSPIVQFSMEVFNALNSNNYVRFFRLVRSSQYLCACLLHRYFTQARQQAIRILNHSHSVPNKEMPYPLSELTQMLEFEDENEAANFCRCHGLTVSEPNVVFIRGSFVEPENAFPPSKSLRLIESKRKSLIGEMVYNGPLPTKPSHNPVSSFSPNGQYISDSHVLPRSPVNIALATSPLTKGAFPKTHISVEEGYGAADSTVHRFSPPQNSTEPAKPTVNIDIEEQKEVTKTLFLEVINEMLVEITNDVFSTVQLLLRLSNDICREIEECSTSSLLQEIAQSSILDEQRHQIMKAEQAASREKASSALASDIVDEVIDEECHQTANVVYNIEQEKIVQKCKDMAIQQISKNILEQSVHEEIQKLVEESCVELKAQRKLALQRIANRLIAVRTDRYFKRWVKKYRSLQRLKKLLGNFPAHCSLASPEQQLGRLIGPQYDAGTCTFHSTRIFGEEQNVAETISSKQAQLEQMRSRLLHPIDIPELIFNLSNPAFNRSTTVNSSCMDWKLLISFAKPCQDPDYFILNDNNANLKPSVIKAKFTKGIITKNIASSLSRKFELLSLYRAEMPLGLSVRKSCRICTLASYGVPTNNEMTEITTSRQMVGTSAVLIVVESIELQTVSLRQELSTRVQRLLESIPLIPGIPVLILFLENQEQQDNFTEEEIIEAVGIPNHLNHVSSVQVTRLPMLTKIERLNDVLKTAVSWLLHSYTELKLECSSLKDFVEEGVQQLFCTCFYDDFATRRRAGLGSQCPEASIALYNAVIDHLALVAASSKLGHVSWPAKEFYQAESSDIYWNTEPSLSSLRSVILSLMLPPPPPRAENGLWESEAQLCRQYIQQLSHNSTYLTQRVDSLLKRKRHSLHKSQVVAENIPWTQVIEACVSSVLLSLYTDSVLSQCKVHFFGNELETLQQPEIWRKAVLSSKEESTSESSRIQGNPFKKSKEALIHESVRSINEDLELILNNSNKHVVHKKKQSTSNENSIVDLKARLGLALSEARDDIVSFEKDLKRWLPEYYPGSSKKRKAEPAMQFQSPIVKSSRQSILDLPPQDTNIDMSHKAQGIRHN